MSMIFGLHYLNWYLEESGQTNYFGFYVTGTINDHISVDRFLITIWSDGIRECLF